MSALQCHPCLNPFSLFRDQYERYADIFGDFCVSTGWARILS